MTGRLPLKRLAEVSLGKMLQSEPREPSDVQQFYLRAANVQPDGVLAVADAKTMWFSATEVRALDVRSGDVVVVEGGVGGFGRAAFVPEDLKGWAYQNSINRLRPFVGVDGRFLTYALLSLRASGWIRAYCNIVSMPHLTADKLRELKVPAPAFSTQCAIADYLDRETARIDELIAEQAALVVSLAERRSSLVDSAVIGGMHVGGNLRDSGLEWLGTIPEGWRVVPFRLAAHFQEGPGILSESFRDEGIPLIRIADVRGRFVTVSGTNFLEPAEVAQRWTHFRLRSGDLLISASASMGTVSEVDEVAEGAVPYTGLMRFVPILLERDYLRWLLGSGFLTTQADLYKTGTAIQHFGPTHLTLMKCLIPPRGEQLEIAKHLDAATKRLDDLASESRELINLLTERRAALITAAVTGQIDVRSNVNSRDD